MAQKVSFHTLGCRLNFSESGTIAQGFAKRGFEIVAFGEKSDVTFINTCTVTDSADSTCRNIIRKAHRASPEGQIVVAGCYSQMDPHVLSEMKGVDLILGTHEKNKVFDYLEDNKGEKIHIEKSNEFFKAQTTPSDSHTRAFLKIQDGCNYVCSFCIIPKARGRSRAISIRSVLSQAKEIVQDGFKEIVLTGVNIGEYEEASGEKLHHLVEAILELEGLERFRLSSVEPNTMSEDLLKVLSSSKKSLPHFHLPLQSGDNEILKSMRRKYLVEDYENIISKVKSYFPKASFGADVMVGYPGETGQQFLNTYKLIEKLNLTHLHVFPYSKRKETTAAKLEDQIHYEEKKSRVKKLIELGEKNLSHFMDKRVGESASVLFEQKDKTGLWEGHTEDFFKIKLKSEANLKNKILKTRLIKKVENTFFGEFLS